MPEWISDSFWADNLMLLNKNVNRKRRKLQNNTKKITLVGNITLDKKVDSIVDLSRLFSTISLLLVYLFIKYLFKAPRRCI